MGRDFNYIGLPFIENLKESIRPAIEFRPVVVSRFGTVVVVDASDSNIALPPANVTPVAGCGANTPGGAYRPMSTR